MARVRESDADYDSIYTLHIVRVRCCARLLHLLCVLLLLRCCCIVVAVVA